MKSAWTGMRFALGLLEIGRPWAVTRQVPDEKSARRFLEHAYAAGVQVFDTAPSYALSEARFGAFLKSLTPGQRSELFVATKFGETWNPERGEPDTSHAYDALRRSVDRSLELLGAVDLLQVHKATPETLLSRDVARAMEYAAGLGVPAFGASVKDLATAHVAYTDPRFVQLQFPFNAANRSMRQALIEGRAAGRLLFLNSPFNMGALLGVVGSPAAAIRAVIEEPFNGAILFGTASEAHLDEDLRAFREVVR